MKKIKDINTLDDAIEALKILYIANMTQLAIFKGIVNVKDNNQISNLEERLEQEINQIILNDGIDSNEKIVYIKSLIESTYNLDNKTIEELKDIYVTKMLQKAISLGRLYKTSNENGFSEQVLEDKQKEKNLDLKKYLKLKEQLQVNIEKLLEKVNSQQNGDKAKEYLKIAIDDINDPVNADINDKMEKFFKQYIDNLFEKIVEIQGNTTNKDKIIDVIDNMVNLNFHEDLDKSNVDKYGDLVKERKTRRKEIFRNSNMIFEKLADYSVGKTSTKIENQKVIAKIDNEKISKYKLIMATPNGEIVETSFFGKNNLDDLLNGEIDYLPAILASISKAKKEGREYIGEITIVDEELGTTVLLYDEKLEQKVKELKFKEENQNDECFIPTINDNNKNR